MKKQTKIVATISDINCDYDFIKRLYDEGMNIVRLNTAYQSPQNTRHVIEVVRRVSEKIPLLLDTKGPEIRTGQMAENCQVQAGDIVFLQGDENYGGEKNVIPLSYRQFVAEVPVNARILIDDGDIELLVQAREETRLKCVVQNSGTIKSKKSVNIPGVVLNLPALSSKDLEYIDFAIENDIDFIAHSFVRCQEDVLAIQEILDRKQSRIKIIAKIENQQGMDNLSTIVRHVYGVMVARGDLGIEIPAEKIPIIQKEIIHLCNCARKPVIVATQMLHSMIGNPRPTRAEVSDVANAVFMGADALMLSGETATGKYPVEAVQIMSRIAMEVEANKRGHADCQQPVLNKISAFLCQAAVTACEQLAIKAVVADSVSGNTVRELAYYRNNVPIYAICYDQRVMRELALSYGVYADFMPRPGSSDEFIRKALQALLDKYKFAADDRVVIVAGNFEKGQQASFIDIRTVGR